MKDILETLAQSEDLTQEKAERAFEMLMTGEAGPVRSAALLMGLRAKGETGLELAAGVKTALGHALAVEGIEGPRIDTCGTGGDCRSSFNCSTATAMVLASMGFQVVKHGNRSVSSSCGSADVLEAFGIPLTAGPEQVVESIRKTGFAFLFAPNFHPAFKNVVPIRKEMGIRTLFNLMGPLLNPARPTHQMIGVPSTDFLEIMAHALAQNGVERGVVVHGALGYDELTPFGPNEVIYVTNGETRKDIVDPTTLGLQGGKPDDVAVSGPTESLDVMRQLLAGKGPETMQNMLILNVAMGISLLNDCELTKTVEKAREVILSGQAAQHFGVEHA